MQFSKNGVEIKSVGTQGLGIIATKNFKAEEIILDRIGKIIDYKTVYSIQIGEKMHFDDNLYKYLNHSCDANCYFKINSNGLPVLKTKWEIIPGDQITADYDTFEYETAFMDKIPCQCGSSHCRKYIRGWKFLSPEDRQRLAPYTLDYLMKMNVPIIR